MNRTKPNEHGDLSGRGGGSVGDFHRDETAPPVPKAKLASSSGARGRMVLESALRLLAEIEVLRSEQDNHGSCSRARADADAICDLLRNKLG